jgi:hypothetical protein
MVGIYPDRGTDAVYILIFSITNGMMIFTFQTRPCTLTGPRIAAGGFVVYAHINPLSPWLINARISLSRQQVVRGPR